MARKRYSCNLPSITLFFHNTHNNFFSFKRLNESHESDVRDLVEALADQRDEELCQRLHNAKVLAINIKNICAGEFAIVVETLYHTWEQDELQNRFFEHKETTRRVVELPFFIPTTSFLEGEEEASFMAAFLEAAQKGRDENIKKFQG